MAREHALKVVETNSLVLDRMEDRIRGLSWAEIEAQNEPIQRWLRGLDERFAQITSLHLTRPDGHLADADHPHRQAHQGADRADGGPPGRALGLHERLMPADDPVEGSLTVEPQRFAIVPEWMIDATVSDAAFRQRLICTAECRGRARSIAPRS